MSVIPSSIPGQAFCFRHNKALSEDRLYGQSSLVGAFGPVCSAIIAQLEQIGDGSMPRGYPRLRTSNQKKNQIGQRVRDRRDQLTLTQDTLCARLAQTTNGLWIPDRREIYRIEDGRRIVSDLEILALAEALECYPCWLLVGDSPDNKHVQVKSRGLSE